MALCSSFRPLVRPRASLCVSFTASHLPRPATLPLRPIKAASSSFSTTASAKMPLTKVTPEQLLARNRDWNEEIERTDANLFKENAAGQTPSILWIGCSDSRVPESVVANCKPGDIFTHRNIANQFHLSDDSAMSVLTYGVEALGVEHVIIVGHTSCGGVLASLGTAESKAALPSAPLSRFLTPLVELSASVRASMGLQDGQAPKTEDEKKQLLTAATEANVKRQVENVVQSDVIKANWQGKKSAFPGEPAVRVKVHGWVHDVSTGKLKDLGVTQ